MPAYDEATGKLIPVPIASIPQGKPIPPRGESELRKALDTYVRDTEALEAIADRLRGEAHAARNALRNVAKITDGDAIAQGINALRAQADKLSDARAEAANRFKASLDGVLAREVDKIAGLAAMPYQLGPTPVASDFLASVCKDFRAAKGDYEQRQRLCDLVFLTLSAVADSLEPKETPNE